MASMKPHVATRPGVAACLLLVFLLVIPHRAQTRTFRILVVMSYEKNFYWVHDLSRGIREVLGKGNNIRWFYMDGKIAPERAQHQGEQAFALYKKYRPDGIIAADDLAQIHFVLPYIRNRTTTPTIFVGVNKDPKKYQYPADNVTGIVEKIPIIQTLAFARMILPKARQVAFMMRNGPTAEGFFKQIHRDETAFPLRINSLNSPETLEEAVDIAATLRDKVDCLYIGGLEGLRDHNGIPMSEQNIFRHLDHTFGKPILGATAHHVHNGALLAVAQNGRQQGKLAANMLLQAMHGTPISKMPIISDTSCERILNIAAMRALRISPNPAVLVGARLILPPP